MNLREGGWLLKIRVKNSFTGTMVKWWIKREEARRSTHFIIRKAFHLFSFFLCGLLCSIFQVELLDMSLPVVPAHKKPVGNLWKDCYLWNCFPDSVEERQTDRQLHQINFWRLFHFFVFAYWTEYEFLL